MEQTDLRTCRTVARLALPDHMHGLVAGDGAPSCPERAKMLTRADPTLDSPMILFQHIVEILNRSMPAILHQTALGFEFYEGWRISGLLVGVDDPRMRMVPTSQGFGQKALGGRGIALGRKKEVDGRPSGIHRAVGKSANTSRPQAGSFPVQIAAT